MSRINQPKLSIVVPCYNESGNIPLIFDAFSAVLAQYSNSEILLVNNGSTDNSEEIFQNELKKYQDKRFKLVQILENKGYGFGILSGLEKATGEILAWTHADMQTNPMDVLAALNLFLKQNNSNLLIKGKRKKRKFAEAFFTFGMQILASLVLKTYIDDINAQPKLFAREFYESWKKNAPNDFSLDLFVLYQAKKRGKILTIPVYFKKRIHGEAKGGGSLKTRLKLIKRTFKYIFELKKEKGLR